MRERDGGNVCLIVDVSYIDTSDPAATLARGANWTEVAAQVGAYGPQWEPAPAPKRDTTLGAPSLAYMQPQRRGYYRRGRR
jgi:hypothetical protein